MSWGPWHLNESLVALTGELKTMFPGIVIGTIADDHHKPPSDHIPNSAQRVNAVDPMYGHGFGSAQAAQLASHLIHDKRTKYVITEKRIWTREDGWHAYHGTDPHTGHLHLSVLDSSHTDTTPWDIGRTRTVTFKNISGYLPTLLIGDSDPIAVTGSDGGGMHYVTRAQIIANYLVPEDVKADGDYGPKTAAAITKIMGGGNGQQINDSVWARLYGLRMLP